MKLGGCQLDFVILSEGTKGLLQNVNAWARQETAQSETQPGTVRASG